MVVMDASDWQVLLQLHEQSLGCAKSVARKQNPHQLLDVTTLGLPPLAWAVSVSCCCHLLLCS
jgi:hypothetical protein